MSVQPAIAEPKVRRYVSSDITKILELARRACVQASVPYSPERLKFVLDNNLNNAFLCCLVLIDLTEVVGVLIASVRKSLLNNDSVAEEGLFYTEEDYRTTEINLIRAEYVDWAKLRGCREVRVSDLYMPGIITPSFAVWKEIL